jgi:glycosyltransferase involved in cell wall biosynthesis
MTPYASCLLLMIVGNLLAIKMSWGLFGVVAVGAISNMSLAILSLSLTGRHYPILRRKCARIALLAPVVGLGALLAVATIRWFCGWVALGTGLHLNTVMFGAALALTLYGVTAWFTERSSRDDSSSCQPDADKMDPPSMPVSVVIPCRDRPGLLRRCLQSLADQRDPGKYEVIVVDSSSDAQVTQVIAEFPGVRRVATERPLDAGTARNLGARESCYPILAFLDADCRVHTDWLPELRYALRHGARVVGGAVLDQMPWSPAAAAGHFIQLCEAGPARPEASTTRLSGSQLGMQRSSFDELGGFPQGRGEDVALTRTAARRWPGSVRYIPEMLIYHASGDSVREFWMRSWQLGLDRAIAGPIPRIIGLLGRSHVASLMAGAARFAYIFWRTVRWHPRALPRFLLFSPLVLLGCLRWGSGLAAGFKNAASGR